MDACIARPNFAFESIAAGMRITLLGAKKQSIDTMKTYINRM